jgi:hypothetical protein
MARTPTATRLWLAAMTALYNASALAQSAPGDAGVAAEAPSPAAIESEALVAQGIQYRRASQDEQALTAFRRAYELTPSPRIRAQIALAEQALGRWVEAEITLRAALAQPSDEWIARNLAALEAALEGITEHLGSLEVSSTQPGATLWVNGRQVGALPLAAPVRIETGSTQIEVRLAGYNTGRRTIEVAPRRSYRESFSLVPISDEPVVVRTTGPVRVVNVTEEYVAPRASVPLIVVGGALLLGGAGAHVFWQNRVLVFNSGAPGGGVTAGACYDPTQQFPTRFDRCGAVLGESWAGFGLTVAGYVLGGAALATGVALRFVGGERRVREVAPARASVTLACTPTVLTAGLACTGAF